ncbi:hypothetical protein QB607_003097 [Clostridium botulinum]|nr:hypothetical protein [Clostridium botulinum]EKS4395770.1 hypothetical protein [Clostridium botulinum]
MDLLEMLKEIARECEKKSLELDIENLKNKVNVKEQSKQNNLNNTFHINLNDMKNKINKENNKNTNYKTTPNKKEEVVDNRKDLSKGDVVKIIDGDYKALSNKECKFLEYCKGMDKVLLQLDELNPLFVNPEDVELVRKAKEKYEATTFNAIEDKYENLIVEIENDMLTVILQDGTKSKKQLKGETKAKIMKISYYDAKIKQYFKISQKLNDIK